MATAPRRAPQPELWNRLVALDLDGPAALPFSRRLARDNGWPPAFAERVVLEYKKFVYLAATCGHPVTPSDEVDQAWHLHLVYTRSYWDELCGQVLGFALHHGPTQGGAAEGHKFQDWYAATRQAYEAAFGSAPPADIWPPAAVRFGDAPHFRRVNMRGKWLLPKPRLPRWQWPRLATGQLAALALAALLVLAGCTARTPLNPFNWYGTEFLLLFWTLGATLLPLACWARYRGRGPLEDYPGELPSTYALARLAQRGRLVADSALAALSYAGHIVFPAPNVVMRTSQAPPTNAYELSIWREIGPTGSPLAETRRWGLSASNAALRALDEELLATGLLLPAPERQRLNRLPLAAAAALGLFGLVKLLVGLSRGRPVEFLIISLVVLAFATILLTQLGAWATGRGATVLRGIAERLARQRGRADGPNVVIMAVAVLGISSLHSLGLGQLAASLAPAADGSGGDSGGSGCGGGGCGGGGCGGCGS
ncbi:TIGR04222 domain-containing membrane protein [Hymenobacter cheonanensis]|uniref:TIGR04222 domain-containing membrane protein n=1 Tax=Hymenobacter sp. CA2-7 TaxID=3063993 RepID=UPI002712EB86|nr:TIGR04222 domain-containing membrane protein [Hymenobacter sp. CA2-7]MDO7884785.1 TIGR04222 domain-containing membrane protein [Hymenobacter sp. CA2-7]